MEKVVKSDAEWQAQLSDLAYKVTRKHGTERAFTHDDFPKAAGTFRCVCCGAPLFDQATNSTRGPAGRRSGSRSTPRWWASRRTGASSCAAPKCTATDATRIWAMSSPTARDRRGCATA
jgi:hypothetical protein